MSWESFFTDSEMTLERIVWPLFIGIVIAILAVLYNRKLLGQFVRKLRKDGIDSAENAITLADAGFAKNYPVRMALHKRGSLRRTVSICDEGEDKPADLDRARFYVSPEKADRADELYVKDRSSLLIILLAIALFLGAVLFVLFVAPELVQMLSNFVNSLID